jgi:phosphatidate cytidylyltransferase
VELFDVLRRAGHRPATLMGLTATVSIMLAAYARGETAVPLVITLAVVFTLLWYLAGVVRARPTVNVAVTLLAFLWVGFLGSFSALLLRLPNRHGIAYLLGAVLATVAYDVGGFFIGSRSGRTPLAPEISPNKTWEGLLGGSAAAVIVSVLITRAIHPWDLGSAFALGLAVAAVAPLGDLCQSMIKRDLGVKDMGTMLPGHGGMLDRFDALLFVLPATYYLVRLLDLA